MRDLEDHEDLLLWMNRTKDLLEHIILLKRKLVMMEDTHE